LSRKSDKNPGQKEPASRKRGKSQKKGRIINQERSLGRRNRRKTLKKGRNRSEKGFKLGKIIT